jgi:proteasome activator subunit 4
MTEGRLDIGNFDALEENEISRATTPGGYSSEKNKMENQRKKTYPYFQYLPYEVEDESIVQGYLEEILKNLYIAVEAGDFAPGALHWTRELKSWLTLKFELPKEQRIKLVKLYYELALAPGIDVAIAEKFASIFMVLTK